MLKIRFWITLTCLFMSPPAWATPLGPMGPIVQVREQLRQWLARDPGAAYIRVGGETVVATGLVREFYARRHYEPVWTNAYGPMSRAHYLLFALEELKKRGLEPGDYHVRRLKWIFTDLADRKYQAWGLPQGGNLTLAEILLTDAFFSSAAHLAFGRVDGRALGERSDTQTQDLDLPTLLERNLNAPAFSEVLDQLEPKSGEYGALKQILDSYLKLAEKPELLLVPASSLNPDPNARKVVPELRARLSALGDLPAMDDGLDSIPAEIVYAGLRHFQERLGLPPTGEMDEKTLKELNRPPAEWVDRIRVNLERLRWQSCLEEPRQIRVNIPDFSLEYIRDAQAALRMKVVVGQKYNCTPIFSNQVRFIILNPKWEMPPDLVIQQKLKTMQQEPDYFKKNHITVIAGWDEEAVEIDPAKINWLQVTRSDIYERYRFRMASGPANPLGRVKFMFPNEYNVYLHDTPKRELFEQDVRNKSFGCIRLEKPIELAVQCLQGHRFWNEERIRSALESGLEQKIKLTKPIPIHILYSTAWAGADGTLQIRADIDGRDEKIRRAFHADYFPAELGTYPKEMEKNGQEQPRR